jgi:hypothetical protein
MGAQKSRLYSGSFSFQTGALAGRMLFESPLGTNKKDIF